jgi:hypothetical protein
MEQVIHIPEDAFTVKIPCMNLILLICPQRDFIGFIE